MPDKDTLLQFLTEVDELLTRLHGQVPADCLGDLARVRRTGLALYFGIRAEEEHLAFRDYVHEVVEDRLRFELTTPGEEAAA
jgi:hypothetical protein